MNVFVFLFHLLSVNETHSEKGRKLGMNLKSNFLIGIEKPHVEWAISQLQGPGSILEIHFLLESHIL